MKKNFILPCIIILAAGGTTAAMVWQKKEPEKKAVTEPVIMVDTVKLHSRDVIFHVSSQGNVRTNTTRGWSQIRRRISPRPLRLPPLSGLMITPIRGVLPDLQKLDNTLH